MTIKFKDIEYMSIEACKEKTVIVYNAKKRYYYTVKVSLFEYRWTNYLSKDEEMDMYESNLFIYREVRKYSEDNVRRSKMQAIVDNDLQIIAYKQRINDLRFSNKKIASQLRDVK